MIKINVIQNTDQWHIERTGRITGTRFKALMSKQTTKGYQDMITEIVAEILTFEPTEGYENEIMERGKELEPEAREIYEEIYDCKVEQVGFIVPDEDNKYHKWIGISPDGIMSNKGLEIKCPLVKTHLNYIKDNRLPAEYKYQVQAQMFVTGLESWDFMSYYPGLKPFIINCKADYELFEEFDERLKIAIKDIKEGLNNYKKYTIQ